LVWVLATAPDADVRRGVEAVVLGETLLARAEAPGADLLDNVAAAYAEVGRFDDAVATARRAHAAAEADGNTELATEITARLAEYAAGRPYRSE
jgi:hypothetical protein